jgi:hypothetical protein
MYAWVSTLENDTAIPSTATGLQPRFEIASKDIWYSDAVDAQPAERADNYMHVCVVDEVGNVGYAHAKFGFDTVPPVILEAKFAKEAYNTQNATIKLTCEDATSQVAKMYISGDITDPSPEEGEVFSSTREVQLDIANDGYKSVIITVEDNAGLSATKVIACELDRSFPIPSIELYDAANETKKPQYSPVDAFSVRIKVDEGADEIGGCQYQLYGDFAYAKNQEQGILFNNSDESWSNFITDTGVDYMTISDLYCTATEGTKEIYIKVRDNAGNILKDDNGNEIITKASFIYDISAPEVTILKYDHNRISKVHSERIRNADCVWEKCYADECRFTFEPANGEYIQAYKVCAYLTAEDAANGSAADPYIGSVTEALGETPTSTLTHQESINSASVKEVKITGQDFERELIRAAGEAYDPEVGVDGARWVVVYVQDLAGTWSVAAKFEA